MQLKFIVTSPLLRSLRHRNYRLYLSGQLVSVCGTWMQQVALSWLIYRLTGSADLYADDGRSAYNSINFITCHDGFTLYDLLSYNTKHNEANGEGNRDGTDDNNSWNCGAEGDTNDQEVRHLRKQLAKNHICHLLFSSGTPMVLGGDEFLRTQKGNNNAYCQDKEISWVDWGSVDRPLLEFVRWLVAFRRRHPII